MDRRSRARAPALVAGLFFATAALTACLERGAPPVVPTMVVAVAPVDSSRGLHVERGSGETRTSKAAELRREGDHVDVEWRGSWFPAVLLERRAAGFLVHYEDFGDEWDEVVSLERIRDRSMRLEDTEVEDEVEP